MDGDFNTGSGYDQDGARRRKRSFDDASGGNGNSGSRQDNYDPRFSNSGGGDYNNNGGYHKRARYDDRGGGNGNNNYRPRDNYRRDDDRYGGNSGGRARGRYDDRGRGERFSSGGSSNGESDRARAWRLTKKAVVELGEATQLGDDVPGGAPLREHVLAAAAKVLTELEATNEEAKLKHATTLVLRCVSTLAHKTALLAVLVGVVNEKKPAFGRKVVDATLATLERDVAFFSTEQLPTAADDPDTVALRTSSDVAGVAMRVRLLVRFLGALVSARVVRCDDVLRVLDALQAACTPDDFATADGDETQLRTREHAMAFKDFVATVVLDTLLHCGQSLAVHCEDMYESLLSRCKEYVATREEESNPRGTETDQPTSWLVRRLRLDLVWEPETEEEQTAFCKKCDPLAQLWEALNLVRAAASTGESTWSIPGIAYPQEHFSAHFGAAEPHAITSVVTVDISTLDCAKIPPYAPLFRILSDDSGAAGSAIANLPLASYIIARNQLFCALQTFMPKPAMAAKQLLSLCKNLNVRFADAGIAAVKTEFLLLETLFVAALTETTKRATVAYYCAVLYHLVKTDARNVSAALAIVVELLFREIAFMSATAVDNLVEVFSHFLANFEFKWPWANWTHVLEAQEDDAQRLFVSAVIERCVRLSYLQHMQTVLPTEFHMLLPPAPTPRIRFEVEGDLVDDTAGDTAAASTASGSSVTAATRNFYNAVVEKLKSHPPAAALQRWVDDEVATTGIARSDAVEIVWTCILDAGAATFTHMRLLLDKYGRTEALFRADVDREATELVLVKTVGSVWLKSPQHIGLILHQMLQHELIRATTIAKWIFTPDAVQQYSWPYVWGILHNTLAFVQTAIADKTRQLGTISTAGTVTGSSNETEMIDVDAVEAARTTLIAELQAMLVLLFDGFNRVVSEHKSTCDADGVAYRDNWFVSALAQLKALGGQFRAAMDDVAPTLRANVFSANAADHDVKKVFHFVLDSYRSA